MRASTLDHQQASVDGGRTKGQLNNATRRTIQPASVTGKPTVTIPETRRSQANNSKWTVNVRDGDKHAHRRSIDTSMEMQQPPLKDGLATTENKR